MIKVQTFEDTIERPINILAIQTLGAYVLHERFSDGPFNPLFEVPSEPDKEVVVTFGAKTADASGNTDGLRDALNFTTALSGMLKDTRSPKNIAAIGGLLSDLGAVISRSADSSVGMFGLRINAGLNGEFVGSMNNSPFLSLVTKQSIVSEAVHRTRANAMNELDAILGVRTDDQHETYEIKRRDDYYDILNQTDRTITHQHKGPDLNTNDFRHFQINDLPPSKF